MLVLSRGGGGERHEGRETDSEGEQIEKTLIGIDRNPFH